MMLRGQKERCQAALRSSACRVDSSSSRSSSSSSSDGSHSVHRHSKVLMSGLRERNAYSLENKATMSLNSHLIQTYTGHAGDSATSWRDHFRQTILTTVPPFSIRGVILGGDTLIHFLAEELDEKVHIILMSV